MKKLIPVILFIFPIISACSSDATYTLYRNSVTDPLMRLHVATFDANDGAGYNQGNCQIAQELFQNQEGVTTKFWCEKGRFKK
ncbi:hypothetical protein MCEKH45_01098 [Methylophilaceae bacterium]